MSNQVFNLPSQVVITPAVTTSSFKLLNAVDSYVRKMVIATIAFENGGTHQIVVWRDDAYTAIGQWTDDDLYNALPDAVQAFIDKGFKNEEKGPLNAFNRNTAQ